MTLDLTKCINLFRRGIIYTTNASSAERIIAQQQIDINPDGRYGPGVYFSKTINQALVNSNELIVYLYADVYLGKCYQCKSEDYQIVKDNRQELRNNGFTSIIADGRSREASIVVFNNSRIKNIQFCFGHQIQHPIFLNQRMRYTFFISVNPNDATNIVERQKIPKKDGPFGNTIYLFNSINDAISINPAKTFLAAEVHIEGAHYLENAIDINTDQVPENSKVFYGIVNNIQYIAVKDKTLIQIIHFCGGQPY